jgi:hypothetical protein
VAKEGERTRGGKVVKGRTSKAIIVPKEIRSNPLVEEGKRKIVAEQ